MAATFTTSQISVFGNLRVRTGVVHLNDGAEAVNFGFSNVVGCVVSPASCATVGQVAPVVVNSTAGTVGLQSFASGDALNFLVMGV